MYVHLGQNVIAKEKNIVGIFDLDSCTIEKATKDFLYTAESKKKIITVSTDLPKSFVVYQEGKGVSEKIFISPLATSTLIRRKEERRFL